MGPKATTTSLTPGTSVRCRYRNGAHATQPWLDYDHQGVVLALGDVDDALECALRLAPHGTYRVVDTHDGRVIP